MKQCPQLDSGGLVRSEADPLRQDFALPGVLGLCRGTPLVPQRQRLLKLIGLGACPMQRHADAHPLVTGALSGHRIECLPDLLPRGVDRPVCGNGALFVLRQHPTPQVQQGLGDDGHPGPVAVARPVVGLACLGVDRRGQHILHREAADRSAAQLVCRDAAVHDLLRWQRSAEGHRVQQLAVPGLARVDDHGVRCIVEGLQVNAMLCQQAGGHGPVVDVKGHRAAVRMGQADAVAVRQIALGLEGVLFEVPARCARPLGVGWDGHK